MLMEKKAARYYLSSFSNLIAAFGGGMILGKGVNVIHASLLQGSSMLAFFVGTVLGLVFLQSVPEKFSKALARWFSICGAATSLILFIIFENNLANEKLSDRIALLFFFLLSIRFAFWFYSRVLRAAAVAGQQQRIAWVEFGYYSGIILGLIVWKFLGIDMGMAIALLIDAFLQFSAGCLDLVVSHKYTFSVDHTAIASHPYPDDEQKYSDRKKIWGWRLAIAVMFLTIGVQVIIFNLAHHVSENFSAYLLAAFYLGVAIAAVFCRKFKVKLEWPLAHDNLGYAIICSGTSIKKQSVSFLLGSALSAFLVILAILGTTHWQWGSLVSIESHRFLSSTMDIENISLLTLICISAFFYEILSLSLLDRIGLEEETSHTRGMVIRTYGLMGIGAAVSFWILDITQSSLRGLLIALCLCLILAILMVWRRHFIDSTIQQNLAVENIMT